MQGYCHCCTTTHLCTCPNTKLEETSNVPTHRRSANRLWLNQTVGSMMQSSETSNSSFSHFCISQPCLSCPEGVSVWPRAAMASRQMCDAFALRYQLRVWHGKKGGAERRKATFADISVFTIGHQCSVFTCLVISCQSPGCFLPHHSTESLSAFIFPHLYIRPFKSILSISWDSAAALQKQQNRESHQEWKWKRQSETSSI